MNHVKINNRLYKVNKGYTILRLLDRLNIEVPKFCYHEYLEIAGNCRMCVVEIEKILKPVVSCATDVFEGMSVHTDTPFVKKSRESVLEFLLLNHPLDCPICDQGGECDLQEQTLRYGSDFNRNFKTPRRKVEDKFFGPTIKTIMTRCIHCTRCVRFTEEATGNYDLGTLGRGNDTEIGFYISKTLDTEFSSNVVDLCPVGALTSSSYAFKSRKWELTNILIPDLISDYCNHVNVSFSRGIKKEVDHFKNEKSTESFKIVRIQPVGNIKQNSEWISDYTRYSLNLWENIFVTRKENTKNSKLEVSLHFTNVYIEPFLFKVFKNVSNLAFNTNL